MKDRRQELTKLATSELHQHAEQEAAVFELPPDWQEGRQIRYGVTMDGAYSTDIDDAISLQEFPDESAVLHVSIADVGSSAAPEQ